MITCTIFSVQIYLLSYIIILICNLNPFQVHSVDVSLQRLFSYQKHKKKKKVESFNFSALHLLHDPQGRYTSYWMNSFVVINQTILSVRGGFIIYLMAHMMLGLSAHSTTYSGLALYFKTNSGNLKMSSEVHKMLVWNQIMWSYNQGGLKIKACKTEGALYLQKEPTAKVSLLHLILLELLGILPFWITFQVFCCS